VIAALNHIVAQVDHQLGILMPWWLVLILWGLIAGGLSAVIYWLTAPEKRLAEARKEAADARLLLNRYIDHDAEFGRTMKQAWTSIRLSLKEVGLSAGPTLFSCVPGLVLIGAVGRTPQDRLVVDLPWWCSGEAVFFASTILAALALRRVLAHR